MITEAAKTALTELRTLQQSYLTLGALRKLDNCVDTIRNEAKAQGISTYRMVRLIEGGQPGWRKEWE
jgi:hypothetical protein